jgi:hypothetical protein
MAKQKQKFNSVDSLLAGTERLFLLLMVGLLPIIVFFLLGWWGSLAITTEENVKYFAIGGLVLGILIDILFLRRWVRKAYSLPVSWFVVFYLFYSVCMFGFFMGMPLFNLFMGLIGGYYVGLCLRYANKEKTEVEQAAKRTALFATSVMALVCLASWMVAYFEPTIAANVQGMLKLEHTLSRERILTYSVFGGVGLVVVEYFITRWMVKFARFM